MTKNEYLTAIIEFLSKSNYHRVRPKKLARMMGVSERDYGDFRAAYKELRDEGRLVLGSSTALTLPYAPQVMRGRFSAHPKGFGFIAPEEPDGARDLFVPPGKTMGAMTGDLVLARVVGHSKRKSEREGKMSLSGEITEILERGLRRFVGTLEKADNYWFVIPDGRKMTSPVIIRDISEAERKPGTKVIVEITEYPDAGELASGVVVEFLGPKGEMDVEIDSTIRSFGLAGDFPSEVLEEARNAALSFDPKATDGREDLTGLTTITIDPQTAKDFDDAISLETRENGRVVLGVHIADVAHFVEEGSPLDEEAKRRGTSVYFLRRVVPMLPETLSNGVCSLQEGVPRFTLSVFIDYDSDANICSTRLAKSIIRSDKRLTYEQAQAVCDGAQNDLPDNITDLMKGMEKLARKIEKRRKKEGMLNLDLKEIELVLDERGQVTDAKPSDDAYTHKIIEMFMVEANDAVAAFFADRGEPIVRRIHPRPNEDAAAQLKAFVEACGHSISMSPSRLELQKLVEEVRDLPESHAINLAVLRSFQKAYYSTKLEEHFALASENYCHFTSPIRRYPDLTVHRAVTRFLSGVKQKEKAEAIEAISTLMSARERNAEAAEFDLKQVMILHHLLRNLGETFEGVITGVADFGIFVEFPRFQIEGVVRLADLGDDWWNVSVKHGTVEGQVTGTFYRIGDHLMVKIAKVDIPMRHMDLLPVKKEREERSPGGFRRPKKRHKISRQV